MSVRKIAFVMYPAQKHFHATRSFYTDMLRIEEGAFYQNIGPDNRWMWLEYDLPHGGCFALTDMPKAGPHPAHSAAFEVDSIEDILARLPCPRHQGTHIRHRHVQNGNDRRPGRQHSHCPQDQKTKAPINFNLALCLQPIRPVYNSNPLHLSANPYPTSPVTLTSQYKCYTNAITH